MKSENSVAPFLKLCGCHKLKLSKKNMLLLIYLFFLVKFSESRLSSSSFLRWKDDNIKKLNNNSMIRTIFQTHFSLASPSRCETQTKETHFSLASPSRWGYLRFDQAFNSAPRSVPRSPHRLKSLTHELSSSLTSDYGFPNF